VIVIGVAAYKSSNRCPVLVCSKSKGKGVKNTCDTRRLSARGSYKKHSWSYKKHYTPSKGKGVCILGNTKLSSWKYQLFERNLGKTQISIKPGTRRRLSVPGWQDLRRIPASPPEHTPFPFEAK
jgi:hypothetical protein